MTWNDRPQPTLTTERLVLRPFRPADAPRVRALAGERAIADTTASIPYPYPEALAEGWIAGHRVRWTAGASADCAITRADDGLLVGAIGLSIDAEALAGLLGYWIGVPYWGDGYATEAARALIDFAFESIGLNRIAATHLTRNPASGRVMQKAGMTFEGISRQAFRKWGVFEDVAQRSILRSEWEASRRGGPGRSPRS